MSDEVKMRVFSQRQKPQMNSTARVFLPEWVSQSAVLIAWPYAKGDFARWLPEVETTYTLIARAIASRQTLIVVVRDTAHRWHVQEQLAAAGIAPVRLILVERPYDDVWVRDTAPLTVQTPEGAELLDFRFNGWGGKYAHADDAHLARRLHEAGLFPQMPLKAVDFVLEGGSVESDGAGTLLTTERCLLNPNRNPSCTQADIESRLQAELGVRRVLWLRHGYAEGDDTDAHVDTLARFCAVDTIAYTACEDPDDILYADLKAMEQELQGFTTFSGTPYRLVPLPIPRPIHSEEGERLPATYANFLIINGAVLVPVYDDPNDVIAMERLAQCFPGREMVAIPSCSLIRQYGSIHCMSMQFPSTVSIGLPS
ncbi:MAG: agmatine deiminase family protein [Alteraurantiacibacter sp.]|nr:agmatine deiminase family protein [Alteraurantiacibacter sp.]